MNYNIEGIDKAGCDRIGNNLFLFYANKACIQVCMP